MLKKNIANSPIATTSIATLAPRTVRIGEDREPDERLGRAALDHDEPDEQDGGDGEDAEHLSGAPARLGRADDAVDERDQAARHRDRAGDVEALVRVLVARLGHEAQREDERDDPDGDVDEEDPRPGEQLDEDAAEDEADGTAADRDRRPDAERLRPLGCPP